MSGRKRAIKWTVIFFTIVIICTFASKTIYYFTLPKVATEKAREGSFTETAILTQGSIEMKGTESYELELPGAIKIDEVYAKKGQKLSAGDDIVRFNAEDIEEQLEALEKQRESAEIALLEFMRGFNSRIDTLRQQVPEGVSDGFINIKSNGIGLITALNVKDGDRVAAGVKLCEISDDKRLLVRLPFSAEYDIKPGMKAEVTIPSAMTTVGGSVREVGGEIALYGAKARMVTIEFDNPGTIAAGGSASAVIEGGITPASDGWIEYSKTTSVYAESSGYISGLNVSLYEKVPAGKLLMKIELPDADSAKTELEYMLSTGIYNGRTEKQMREQLESVNASIEKLSALSETGIIKAETDCYITSIPVRKNMSFMGGILYEYSIEEPKYEVVFTSGEMSEITKNLKCKVVYTINGRQNEANGKIIDVGIGYATVESAKLEQALQAQSIYAEVTLSTETAMYTLPASAVIANKFVYVLKTKDTVLGKQYYASLQEVTTGRRNAYIVEILSSGSGYSLTEDRVITAWDRDLADGVAVDIETGSKS